jgi:type IV secretory pathway component VirB8
MQPDTTQQLKQLEEKIDAIYISVEKTRRYFFWTMIITILVFVLPLIALAFVVPSFINTYTDTINSLGI